MPIVTRKTAPSVRAPNVTQGSQRIEVPKGAFGQDVSRAAAGLGQSISAAALTAGAAIERWEERKSSRQASEAYKDVPINELNSLEDSKKNPGDLSRFQERQTKEFDIRMNAIKEGLPSKRARRKFEEKTLSLRTSLAKNASVWARKEEILQSRNAFNSEIESLITAGTQDFGNIGTYRQDIVSAINTAGKEQILINGKGQRLDPSAVATSTLRRLDLNTAHTYVRDNPARVLEMLGGGELPFLRPEDEIKIEAAAVSSARRQKEVAKLTSLDSHLSARKLFHERRENGTASYQDYETEIRALDAAVASGDEDARSQQVYLEGEQKGAGMSEEDIFRTATDKKVLGIETTQEAKRLTGTATPPKPTAAEKSNALAGFFDEFVKFGVVATDAKKTSTKPKFELDKKDNPIARMSDILDFWTRVNIAQNKELLTKTEGNMFFKKLLPVLRAKVESRHFEEVGDVAWWGKTKEFLGGQREIERPKDKYSDAFSTVLAILEATPSENTTKNQSKALRFAFQIAEQKGIEKIDNVDDRLQAAKDVGAQAVQLMNDDNDPEIRGLKTNMIVRVAQDILENKPHQKSIDALLASPNDKEMIKFFNKKFGKGAAEKILNK